jgi:IS1 family transposase
VVTPRRCTTSWWLFPPRTTEVQFDEKWAFVAKKQEHTDPAADPADTHRGDSWDHVAFDPEHRLVVAVVPGKRNAANCRKLVEEFARRTCGRSLRLMTSDDYPSYKIAILDVYGLRSVPLKVLHPPQRGGAPRSLPRKHPPPGLNYARICKQRKDGRVVKVYVEVVFGSEDSLQAALRQSSVSRAVNISFVERHNGTDRHRNARKSRGTYRISKDWQMHEAMTYYTMYSYNFCWPVRTLDQVDSQRRVHHPQTPAMSAGLSDHVWALHEWITMSAQRW